ncbi:MAG: sodium-dependent transporter, partial [Proteobacteria bacterium]|nr:sodium-dependent transporter [Pseudomonadota bacterium]
MSTQGSINTPTSNAGNTRSGFSSGLGVLAATLGSAVGLGNIWKFPTLTGANGGAGFLLIYLLSTLFIGLPLMVAEIAIGRQARANPISALRQL